MCSPRSSDRATCPAHLILLCVFLYGIYIITQ
jgi:hypothetical protein